MKHILLFSFLCLAILIFSQKKRSFYIESGLNFIEGQSRSADALSLGHYLEVGCKRKKHVFKSALHGRH